MFAQLGSSGFEIIPSVFRQEEIDELIRQIGAEEDFDAGMRNVLDIPAVQELCLDARVAGAVTSALSTRTFATRAILFDKTAKSNWALGMHQDSKIAVKVKIPVQGYSSWSEKEGVTHVKPPAEVMSRSIALRIHLDACGADNGPVHVIPDTPRSGFLSAGEVKRLAAEHTPVACTGDAGSVLIFHSLLLHGSPKARIAGRRRVLHIEFADRDLGWGA